MMLWIIDLVIALCMLGIIFGSYIGFVRNNQVYRFRTKLVDELYEISKLDQSSSSQRSQVYRSVSYNDMVLKFWKPLKPEVWYQNTNFLEPPK